MALFGLDVIVVSGRRSLAHDSLLYRIAELGLLVGIGGDMLAPRAVRGEYRMIAVAMASWWRD